MRIAFILHSFPVVSETFILDQITGLIDQGYDIDIYAKYKYESDHLHSEVGEYNLISKTKFANKLPKNRILRFLKACFLISFYFWNRPKFIIKSFKILNYTSLKELLKALHFAILFLGKNKYDIIHCHFGYMGKIGMMLRDIGILKGKLIVSFYGHDLYTHSQKYGKNFFSNLFEKGDCFLALSKSMKKFLMTMGCVDNKIRIHHLGVNCKKFEPGINLKKNNRQIKILSVARLVQKKGIEYAVKAFGELNSKYRNIVYYIIGDGPLRNELEKLVDRLKLSSKIKFIGYQKRNSVLDHFRDTDIFLAPSIVSDNGDKEGTPVVILEAQAMSIPVVATRHSGIPETIIEDNSGFIIEERNIKEMVKKISFLIDNPSERKNMGQIGRSFMINNFGIDELNKKLTDIYHSLTES